MKKPAHRRVHRPWPSQGTAPPAATRSCLSACQSADRLAVSKLLLRSLEAKPKSGSPASMKAPQGLRTARESPDCAQDAREMKRRGVLSATMASYQSCFCRYQVQIGHRGSHQKLKERLFPAEVAGFAGTKLHQAGNSMLCRLPKHAIGHVRLTALKRPGFLQQSLLGMQGHTSPLARFALHASRPQGTGPTDRSIVPASTFPSCSPTRQLREKAGSRDSCCYTPPAPLSDRPSSCADDLAMTSRSVSAACSCRCSASIHHKVRVSNSSYLRTIRR